MNTENTNSAVIENENTVALLDSATVETSAIETIKKEKKAKKKASAKKEETKKEETVVVSNEIQRHKDIAQFEKVLIHMLKLDARKSVSVVSIKNELEKQIECYRFSVYLWEIRKHVGEVIEKIKEKKTVVALRLIDKQKAQSYIKLRFPELKLSAKQASKEETQA
jgi:hypothetical protein